MYCPNPSPLISVVMGAYNIEGLGDIFQKAISSVCNQTLADFEFIICDDGSLDKTWNILEEISRRDARIQLIKNNENQGLAAALNRCLEKSRGIFIARQDTDDISHPNRFALQIEFLNKYQDIGFVGSNVDLWNEHGIWGERVFPEYPQPKDFLFTQPFVHGAIMFRKSVLKLVGGYRVAKETRRAEDYDMLMRMYSIGVRGANLQQKLYSFLEDDNAQKRRKYSDRIDEAIVRWKGFSELKLMPIALLYIVKPLIVGLLPSVMLKALKKHRDF